MVYWGCSTCRNRCAWAATAAFALTAAALLCVGAGQMWLCNHRAGTAAGGPQQQQAVGNCRVRAGIIMALSPVVVIVGLLPALLFFQSCMAVPPPQPVDWEKDIPASGITVVRRTSNGAAAVYRYDANGKLLQAPDCYSHSGTRAPRSPTKLGPGQQQRAPSPRSPAAGVSSKGLDVPYMQCSTGSTAGMGLGPGSSPRGSLNSPAAGPGVGQARGPGLSPGPGLRLLGVQHGGSWGQYSPQGGAGMQQGVGSSVPGQYSPQAGSWGQYSPQQYSPQASARQYSPQCSAKGEAPAAEVYISLSPLKEAAEKLWSPSGSSQQQQQ